jgi:hypothetical protein
VWYLACLVFTARIIGRAPDRAEAALSVYGDAPGFDQLDDFVAIRGLQVLGWSLLVSAREVQPRLTTVKRLRLLRAHRRPD